MTTAKISVSQLTLYDPARLKDAESIAAFVARKAVFQRILEDIAAEKPASRAQHHLIIGQRGMGKSTLLARLAAELRTNPVLSKRLVPLVFAEEQYAVDRLSKFWLNCLDSLADAAERAGDTIVSDRIDYLVQDLKPRSGYAAAHEEAHARAALEAFLKEAEKVAKRPVLLVDNLQLVFERITAAEQHSLRELLMRPGSPILVGASPSPPPESQDYGAAFYDHFKSHYLRSLSFNEMRELMLKLAETTERTDVRDKVLAHPERLRTLRDLTGGNPRTIVTLFFLYAEDFSPSVFTDLENLLDRVTPLYKARVEELPDQQQVVVSAVADRWAPIAARELSEATGLPMASISAQLDRLEKTGFVEKVEIFDQTSAGYQIAERFFNVWFLMRSASRRQRREIEFLVRFIESFYESKDRPRLAQRLMKERDFSPDRFLFAKALACTLDPNDKEELTRHAELDALHQKAAEARRKMEEVIDFSKLSPATLAFDELREKLMALVPVNSVVSPEAFAEHVLGNRQMFLREEREKLAATEGKLTEEKIKAILKSIADARESDEMEYDENAVIWFSHWLSTGQLRFLGDLEDWNRAFLKADERETVQIMVDSIPRRVGSELKEGVRSRIRSVLAPQSDADAWEWYSWGYDLDFHLGLYSEAESAYRKAIDIDSRFAFPWDGLGDLLQNHLGRYKEAESAYCKAIEIDPRLASPWYGLGDLLQYRLGRYEEAESAYRKAIELDPRDAYPWDGLGDLLQNHLGRYEEAESAYRKAIEIKPQLSYPWDDLGDLLQHHLGRYQEAESAYRKAIELDPRYANPWNGLGNLYQQYLDRYDEAELAYRKAIELDPRDTNPWTGIGILYCDHYQRYSDAASAFAKAVEIDGVNEVDSSNLVFLYRDFLGDMQAAKNAYQPLRNKYQYEFNDAFYLHEALFAAYDANWGLCSEALIKAIEVIDQTLPSITSVDWFRASAVLLHLNYGEELLAFLRERGDDARMRPWYEALSALQRGDRRYLQNIPVEVRTTAEYDFDQIEKRLNALPEKTRRRPKPKSTNKSRKRRRRSG